MTAWQEAVEEAGSPQAIHKSASSASPPLRKDHVDKVLLEIVAGVSPKLVDEPLVERFVDWPPRSPLPHDFEIELPEVRLVVRDGELVHPRSPPRCPGLVPCGTPQTHRRRTTGAARGRRRPGIDVKP